MLELGVENVRALANHFGDAGDGERKWYRWAEGKNRPPYEAVMRMLDATGWLAGEEAGGADGAGATPASSSSAQPLTDHQRLERVEGRVDAILDLNEKSFASIFQTLARLERRLDEQGGSGGRRRKAG